MRGRKRGRRAGRIGHRHAGKKSNRTERTTWGKKKLQKMQTQLKLARDNELEPLSGLLLRYNGVGQAGRGILRKKRSIGGLPKEKKRRECGASVTLSIEGIKPGKAAITAQGKTHTKRQKVTNREDPCREVMKKLLIVRMGAKKREGREGKQERAGRKREETLHRARATGLQSEGLPI